MKGKRSRLSPRQEMLVEKDAPVRMRDGVGSAPYTHYHADYNTGGYNTLHAGPGTASHLLLPIIPPRNH